MDTQQESEILRQAASIECRRRGSHLYSEVSTMWGMWPERLVCDCGASARVIPEGED